MTQSDHLTTYLAELEAQRDRLQSSGPIAPAGSYIERYIARRYRQKTGPKEYIYYRMRNPPDHGPKHQNLGKQGSPKYQAATEAITRRNQLNQVNKEIRQTQRQLQTLQ